MPDRVDLYNHKIRGHRTNITTTTTKPIIETTTTHVQPPVLSRPLPPPPPTQTITTTHQPTHGYRFNYLPVDEPYHPDVFASRIGEHGVYHGHRY